MTTEIARAVAFLRAGELVAFPTETVYGLGADASQPSAVAKIFSAKGRPADHPVIVHIPDVSHVKHWAMDIPDSAYQLAEVFWPGPLTLILKRRPDVSDCLTGGQDTIGLRVPNHPVALELLKVFNGGIAAPSANRFGRISPTTAAHVRDELGNAVSLVLDGGPCDVGIESTILDLSRIKAEILRPGMISSSAIAQIPGIVMASSSAASGGIQGLVPRVSGSLESHYAPRTPLRLVTRENLKREQDEAFRRGERIAILAFEPVEKGDASVLWRKAPNDPEAYAHELYASLRELDTLNCASIIVQRVPVDSVWQAIDDRLHRAAAGTSARDA